jgi:O-antigen ligase
MLAVLIILCALIWLPILVYQISNRGFLVLIIWLAVAPFVSNLAMGRTNPFFKPLKTPEQNSFHGIEPRSSTYNTISMEEMIEQPTRLLITLYMIVLILNSLLIKKRIAPIDRTEVCMGIFALMLLANVYLLSDRFGYSLRLVYDAFIVPFFSYFIARRLVLNVGQLQRLIQLMGYLGGCFFLIGLAEYVIEPGLVSHINGPFRSGTGYFYALMAVFFVMISDSISSRRDGHAKQMFSPFLRWSIVGLIPVTIVMIGSRGAWVGFLCGLWIFMLLGYRVLSISKKIMAIGTLLILVPVLILSTYSLIPKEFVEEHITQMDTVEWRFKRWNVAFQKARETYILGIGFNNLRDILEENLGSDAHVHNSFLTFFVELGGVGLAMFFAIIASLTRLGLRLYRLGRHPRDRLRGAAVLAMLAAYLIPGFFANTILTADFSILYMFVFIGGLAGFYNQSRLVIDSRQMAGMWYQRKTPIDISL